MTGRVAKLLLMLASCAGLALPLPAGAQGQETGRPAEGAVGISTPRWPLETVDAPRVRAVAALDGDTLRLADGRTLRLAGIAAPKPPLDAAADEGWPAAEAARAGLAGLALDRDWLLVPTADGLDRYGRLVGHLVGEPGTEPPVWLNAELVAAGLARVSGHPDLRAGGVALLGAEERARDARRGLWADFRYRVLPAEEAHFGLNRFALVEGRVRAVATVRQRTYLNFGEDWREDFTVSLDAAARRLFRSEGIDPAAFEGRRLRIRGWVAPVNGPMIEVSRPEQIEVLE